MTEIEAKAKADAKAIAESIENAIDRMPHLDSASRAWFVRRFMDLRAVLA